MRPAPYDELFSCAPISGTDSHRPHSMAASFGAGAAFSIVSSLGAPVRERQLACLCTDESSLPAAAVSADCSSGPLAQAGAVVSTAPAAVLMDAIRTGAVFSLLQGAFYQVNKCRVLCV